MRQTPLTDIFVKIAEDFVAKWLAQDIENNIDVNQSVPTTSSLPGFRGTVVLTDLSKAFDLANHNIAIENMYALDVGGGVIIPYIVINASEYDYATLNCWIAKKILSPKK